MGYFPLTEEELRVLFDAVHERDMAALKRENDELRAVLDRATAHLDRMPDKA